MADSKESYEVLKRRNEVLNAELAHLRELATSLEDNSGYEFERLTKKNLADVIDIKEAFERFDKDGNGVIDKDELGLLAEELGEVLDGDELKEAFALINITGDGKITFEQFVKFWQNETRSRTEKSQAKLSLLRAKLVADSVIREAPALMRALSGQKAVDPDDWIHHHLELSVDEPANPQSWLRAQVSFNAPDDAPFEKYPGCGLLLEHTLLAKPGLTAEQRALGTDEVCAALRAVVDIEFEAVTEGDQTRLLFPLKMADPLAMTRQLGLDLNNFVRNAYVKFEMQHPASDLLRDDPDMILANLFKFKFEMDVQFRKALIYALVNAKVPRAEVILFVALLETFSLSLKLGNFESLLRIAKTPEGMDLAEEYVNQTTRTTMAMVEQMVPDPAERALVEQRVREQQRQQLAVLQEAARGHEFLTPSFYLRKGFQKSLRKLYYDMFGTFVGRNPSAARVILAFKAHFQEYKQLIVRSPGGLLVTVDVHNVFPFEYLPNVQFDENGQASVVREE